MGTKKVKPTTSTINPFSDYYEDDPDYYNPCDDKYYDPYDEFCAIYRDNPLEYLAPDGDFLSSSSDWINTVYSLFRFFDKFKPIYEVACYIIFIINIFHLLILTRKELRSNLVYMIMIGVGISDLVQSLGTMAQHFMTLNIVYKIEDCGESGAYRYDHLIVNLVAKSAQVMSRRCSSFLALYIAVIRALAILFPMIQRVATIMKPAYGFLMMIIVLVSCTIWSVVFFVLTEFKKILTCGNLYRPSYVMYKFQVDEQFKYPFMFVDGCMALFVSFSYVILASVLVVAICKAEKRRRSLGSDESSNASKLVTIMAVSVFISETTYGALYVVIYSFDRQYEEM
ncbi:hypothetical protein B9Z55_017868 [Caenorhabditis nigoni]|uniref:G-protein coupled receptors family 1 profile domain-containing protein n=1 Tax=Caenorhabditis nigoni TaxID=1611254 RepID=A0A2G5TB34_9PELO|nr:hypothetical protein B9Z55_017868 [Caenorhabditis nigoni]